MHGKITRDLNILERNFNIIENITHTSYGKEVKKTQTKISKIQIQGQNEYC